MKGDWDDEEEQSGWCETAAGRRRRKSQHAEKWNACSRQLPFPAWETWQNGGGWTLVIKEGEQENIGKKKKVKTARARTQRPFKATAREGTPAP